MTLLLIPRLFSQKQRRLVVIIVVIITVFIHKHRTCTTFPVGTGAFMRRKRRSVSRFNLRLHRQRHRRLQSHSLSRLHHRQLRAH